MALDEAIESENATEALVEQRSQELAEAQAAVTRLRAVTELRIRRVLTPEQLSKLRALKQQALQFRQDRENQLPGPMTPRERQQRRRDALQPNGNPRPDFVPQKQPGAGPPNQRP
jgi:preprotein translocase subunit SecD